MASAIFTSLKLGMGYEKVEVFAIVAAVFLIITLIMLVAGAGMWSAAPAVITAACAYGAYHYGYAAANDLKNEVANTLSQEKAVEYTRPDNVKDQPETVEQPEQVDKVEQPEIDLQKSSGTEELGAPPKSNAFNRFTQNAANHIKNVGATVGTQVIHGEITNLDQLTNATKSAVNEDMQNTLNEALKPAPPAGGLPAHYGGNYFN